MVKPSENQEKNIMLSLFFDLMRSQDFRVSIFVDLKRREEKSKQTQPPVLLTLKAPIKTAADDKFCDIFHNFRKK